MSQCLNVSIRFYWNSQLLDYRFNIIIIYIYIIIILHWRWFYNSYWDNETLRHWDNWDVLYYLIGLQHFNYVFHYVCLIFSMQHTYIVLYCMLNFAFTLIFNILNIEVHYDCHVFTVQRVYSGQNFYIFHTVFYRIHPWTLRKYRCGFMHTRLIFVQRYSPVQFC